MRRKSAARTPMKCNLTLLSQYLDNELDFETRAAVDSHLAECLPCRREMADMKGVDKTLVGLRTRYEAVSPDLDRRIHADVVAPRRRSRMARISSPGVGSLAAAVLIFLVAGHGLPFQPSHNGPTTASVVRQRVAQLTAPLAQSRRASAILDGRTTPSVDETRFHLFRMLYE